MTKQQAIKTDVAIIGAGPSGITAIKNFADLDFEVTAFAKHPQLEKMKEQLYDDGAIYASMSGSGSVLYGVFDR